jgi:hypothetical protein
MLRTVLLAAAVASASAFAPMAGFGRTATKARTGVNLRIPSFGCDAQWTRNELAGAWEEEAAERTRRRAVGGEGALQHRSARARRAAAGRSRRPAVGISGADHVPLWCLVQLL